MTGRVTGAAVCGSGTCQGIALAVGLMLPALAFAGSADVVAATAICSANGTCDFRVTVKHGDEGWEHYADRWEVLSPDGDVLATRVLRHPHVEEQPFTRALQAVPVSDSLSEVRIRAHDSVHGLGGQEVTVRLDR